MGTLYCKSLAESISCEHMLAHNDTDATYAILKQILSTAVFNERHLLPLIILLSAVYTYTFLFIYTYHLSVGISTLKTIFFSSGSCNLYLSVT